MMKATSRTARWTPGLALAIAALLTSGCGMSGGMGADRSEDVTPPGEEEERKVEESDLYKLVGNWLYVQNPHSGLNIINVANPEDPYLHRRLSDVRGEAGELYVREDRVYVLFDGTMGRCSLPPEMEATWATAPVRSEMVLVMTAPTDPKVASRYCLPGSMVASRIVGDFLYMITSNGSSTTWLFSINVANVLNPGLADYRYITGDAREVFVNSDAIFIAQASGDSWGAGGTTTVQYIDITDPDGVMVERGDLMVTGQPWGRFHMDVFENTFRIVTYTDRWSGTNLHVIDISDPDYLWLMSSYEGLAPDEELWATRFVEEKVYIVTYLRFVPQPRDPLWVIDLSDPYTPRLLGGLEIPGWSNFLFPYGDRLLAVGRGDRGAHVAVSLFDVADPYDPREMGRLEFGDDEATSEANADFRGIRLIEDEAFGPIPLIAVPYTNSIMDGDVCTPDHRLQLVNLEGDDLGLMGNWKPPESQQGMIRRTVPIDGNLYVISDRVVATLDISDRNDPYAPVALNVSGPGFTDECPDIDFTIDPGPEEDEVFSFFPFGCNISGPTPIQRSPLPWLVGALILLLAIRWRRAA